LIISSSHFNLGDIFSEIFQGDIITEQTQIFPKDIDIF